MFDDPKEVSASDTIFSAGTFLLLQTNLMSGLRQASASMPSPLGITLLPKHGLLWKDNKIFVPENDHPLAGYFGIHKTLELIQHTFWWLDLEKHCREYVNSCATCTRSKTAKSKAWGLLRPLPVPDRPLKMIAMDYQKVAQLFL